MTWRHKSSPTDHMRRTRGAFAFMIINPFEMFLGILTDIFDEEIFFWLLHFNLNFFWQLIIEPSQVLDAPPSMQVRDWQCLSDACRPQRNRLDLYAEDCKQKSQCNDEVKTGCRCPVCHSGCDFPWTVLQVLSTDSSWSMQIALRKKDWPQSRPIAVARCSGQLAAESVGRYI